jgi:hypothetical protein
MIVKSHIRGGYRAAAQYLKEFGKNEEIRLVEISDPDAQNLDEAFHNMWTVACNSRVKKPLHHISINPFKDERLTDEQVQKIVERCEEKYSYNHGDHQRVIVEHIRDGRQHFHVMWNRVSLATGRPIWPGLHWNKSKQAAREMEIELGLKRPVPRRVKRMQAVIAPNSRGILGHYGSMNDIRRTSLLNPIRQTESTPVRKEQSFVPVMPTPNTKGWPEAAIIDWEVWGHEFPAHFFTKWPTLAAPGFIPMGEPPL